MACSRSNNTEMGHGRIGRLLVKCIGIGAVILLSLSSKESHAWLLYHKPAYKGKFIDADTRNTVEGVVVVAVYQKTLIAGFESFTSTLAVREAVTDKEGVFHIPPFTTLINPLSNSSFVDFVIYKPGYGRYFVKDHPDKSIYGADECESFFKEKFFGQEKILKLQGDSTEVLRLKVVYGLAKLHRIRGEEEKLRAIPDIPGDPHFSTPEMLPLYYKAINRERIRLGLKEVGN